MRVFVEGLGLLGPGLPGWRAGQPVLAGGEPYRRIDTVVAPSALLPPAERRRTGVPVRLALAVGQEAFANARRDAAATATVFASSGGDGDNVHQICEALACPEREVSPTRFHNSVHNAAAGYWSIAMRSREASTSLCCYDDSFAAGLLEAAVQIVADGAPVALIAYDHAYPEPLHAVRPISASFGVALVMAPQATERTFAVLDVEFMPTAASVTRMVDGGLEAVRTGVPAARCLPLLAVLARNAAETVIVDYTGAAHLRLEVAPWA